MAGELILRIAIDPLPFDLYAPMMTVGVSSPILLRSVALLLAICAWPTTETITGTVFNVSLRRRAVTTISPVEAGSVEGWFGLGFGLPSHFRPRRRTRRRLCRRGQREQRQSRDSTRQHSPGHRGPLESCRASSASCLHPRRAPPSLRRSPR
ncbi:hypothetical protein QP185_00795 [Sphingomonas aerolata]|uniref:hypothetical protein n=1 Tax=Sphingomonas aerolata TaxID=185951 RepID=UPI002FE2113C